MRYDAHRWRSVINTDRMWGALQNNLKVKLHYSKFVSKQTLHTIYALSSGYGKCGVAVIRVSGPHAKEALKSVTSMKELPKPRLALLRSIRHPKNDEVLDKGLVLWFPGPNSFTGEDSFELQVHGSVAVVSAILNALGSVDNLRLAQPGEFTRRAFGNGKLDLTEVEGLADLLQAETEVQRKQAFLQCQGFLSKRYNNWRDILIRCVAHIEAHIDFEESDALDEGLFDEVVKSVRVLKRDMETHLSDSVKGELLRNGVKTVILGQPNVGKSSLLNALSMRPAAIVTPVAGTTRDVLDVTLDMGGYPLVLSDTAGLRRDAEDVVEREGIKRARERYENCDLVVFMVDCVKFLSQKQSFAGFVKDEMRYLLDEDVKKPVVVVVNKIDQVDGAFDTNSEACFVSCKTQQGLRELISCLTGKLRELCGEPTEEHPSMNQERHRQHLSDCVAKLNEFLENVQDSVDAVLLAENLRLALKQLGKLTGAVSTEKLLDVIFKDFCVGK